jgi:hypothetical protein
MRVRASAELRLTRVTVVWVAESSETSAATSSPPRRAGGDQGVPAFVARQYDVLPEALSAQLRLLAVRECEPNEYSSSLEAARRAIGKRDPDDVELLALAIAFGIPVWSNDSDLKDAGVEWYSLLANLGPVRPRRTRPAR